MRFALLTLVLLGLAGCDALIATGVRAVELGDIEHRRPTTRPWHFEEFDHDGLHDARVVFDDE